MVWKRHPLSHSSFHWPHAVFIKAGPLSDTALLQRLEIGSASPLEGQDYLPGHAHIHIAFDGMWTHVWTPSYMLYHHLGTAWEPVASKAFPDGAGSPRHPVLGRLSTECDVFCYAFGDCDHSLEYHLYSGGRVRRRVVVLDPSMDNPKLHEDAGEPMPFEPEPHYEGAMEQMPRFSSSLGIAEDYESLEVRTWTRPVNADYYWDSLRAP